MLVDIQDQLEERLDEIMNAPEHKHRWQIIEDTPPGYEDYLFFACFGCEMVLRTCRQAVRYVMMGLDNANVGWTQEMENQNIMAIDEIARLDTHQGFSIIAFRTRQFYVMQLFTDPKEK